MGMDEVHGGFARARARSTGKPALQNPKIRLTSLRVHRGDMDSKKEGQWGTRPIPNLTYSMDKINFDVKLNHRSTSNNTDINYPYIKIA